MGQLHCCFLYGTVLQDGQDRVRMEKYVWSMEVMPLRDEWKFVSTTHGAQCAMTFGTITMLELSADNLDSQLNVSDLAS